MGRASEFRQHICMISFVLRGACIFRDLLSRTRQPARILWLHKV
jgi:hypothetical protein